MDDKIYGAPEDRQVEKPVVEKVEFCQLKSAEGKVIPSPPAAFDTVSLELSAELGQAHMTVKELMKMDKDSLIKLSRLADESVILLVNNTPFAHGEIVIINERFGIRITSFVGEPQEQRKTGR